MILSQWIRLIRDNVSTLSDVSLAGQNDTDTIPFAMASATDFLYVGQHYPFSNLFLDTNAVNTSAASLTIEMWTGSAWDAVVDILDGTQAAGKTLARKGNVAWSTNRNSSWNWVEDTSSGGPSELSTFTIYNLYWLRIAVSADLSAGTILDRVTYAFCSEEQLGRINPEIDSYLSNWETGKTDWYDQIQLASTMVLADLKAKGIVFTRGQIHNYEDICTATAYRALIIILTHLGTDYKDLVASYWKNYQSLLSIKRFDIDKDLSGNLGHSELDSTERSLVR